MNGKGIRSLRPRDDWLLLGCGALAFVLLSLGGKLGTSSSTGQEALMSGLAFLAIATCISLGQIVGIALVDLKELMLDWIAEQRYRLTQAKKRT